MSSTGARPLGASYPWRRWAASCLMLGVSVDRIVAILVSQGFDPDQVRSELGGLQQDPVLEAGRWMADRLSKLESILDARLALGRLAAEQGVDRRTGVSRQEFLERYYAVNRPVLLDDVASTWRALERWQPESLAAIIGDEPVEVMDGRDEDSRYEVNSEAHKRTMSFAAYVAFVRSAEPGNNTYLVANNHLLDREAAQPLWRDFDIDDRYLNPDNAAGSAFLWFGPAGTITPLHHDIGNILFTQIVGRKRVILIASLESHCLYNEVGVFSEVDPRSPDLEKFPRFRRVRPLELILGPGDALFIPVGFWHHVEALDVSVSLSFTNFHFPNHFSWHHPRIIR